MDRTNIREVHGVTTKDTEEFQISISASIDFKHKDKRFIDFLIDFLIVG